MTIERMLRVLDDLDLDPVEVAEALWLAALIPPSSRHQGLSAEHRPAGRGVESPDDRAGSRPGSAEAAQGQDGLLMLDADESEFVEVRRPGIGRRATPVRMVRALRPLRRHAAGSAAVVLDEEATARRRAELGFWLPVLRPIERHRLHLLVITDVSPSMDVWRPLADELRLEFGRSRVFQKLRHRYLRDTPAGPLFSVDPAGQDVRSRRESTRAEQPQAILIVTDGVDAFWRTRAAGDLLRHLAEQGPVAIVQPLPQRLWTHTALRVNIGRLTAFSPLAGNGAFPFAPAAGGSSPSGVKIPVFDADRDWLAAWAALLAGGSAPQTAVVTVDDAWGDTIVAGRAADDPDTLLRTFRASASPAAVQLAALLSAVAPLTLPVIRYVQRLRLPSAGPAEIAEVFLGGLLRRIGLFDRSDPDTTEYDFFPGVRERLIGRLSRPLAGDVCEELLSAVLRQDFVAAGGPVHHTPAMLRTGPLLRVADWTLGRFRPVAGGSAGTNASATGRDVRVVLVGIDEYAGGPSWSLIGPVTDAVRFAALFAALGVPPSQITLLATPRPEESRLPTGIDCRPADRATVRAVFVDELSAARDDMLYVYWAGHGYLDSDRRWLLCSDATADDFSSIDLDAMVTRCGSSVVPALGRQMWLIDVSRSDGPVSRPRTPAYETYNYGDPVPGRVQQVFFATDAWQANGESNRERTSLLSHEVRELLDDGGVDLVTDAERLTGALLDRFTALQADDSLRLPAYLWHHDAAGNERLVLRRPAGTATSLSPRALTTLVDALLDIPEFLNPQDRQEILSLLPDSVYGTIHRHQTARLEAVSVIRTCQLHPGGLPELVAALQFYSQDGRAVARFATAVEQLEAPGNG